jgi:cytosine/adenosine deaminase-related metal-dependent hydrolase
MADEQVLTARWVFPVSGPPVENGTVTVRGETISAVEPKGARTADIDLGNAAIIPGLVNAHTHLDLSGARGLIPPTDPDHFADWLRGVIEFRRSRTIEQVQADIRNGLSACLRSGTTLVGDIASGGLSWEAVSSAPLRSVVFFELIGLSEERYRQAVADSITWAQDKLDHPTCRSALSPHAPYSFRLSFVRQLGGQLLFRPSRASFKQMDPASIMKYLRARTANSRALAIHLAESQVEAELLTRRSGPFVDFLKELGAWDPSGLAWDFEHALTLCGWQGPQLLVHCNYLSPDAPISSNASIVYCPRTHAAFGHPPHPFREFLKRGVRVCLGTDSLASIPDLDILAEARFLHELYPDLPGHQLLRMITLSGAEALGWANEMGSLEPGDSADLVVLPLPNRDDADPYRLIFESDETPGTARLTMWCGTWREPTNHE